MNKENAKEVATLTEDGNKLAADLNRINRTLNRHRAKLITLEKVKPYVLAPDDIEKASEKVLTLHKATGLNEAGWVRAVNLETGGKYSEAQLREHLKTLIGDEIIKEEKAVLGKAKEKKLTLA